MKHGKLTLNSPLLSSSNSSQEEKVTRIVVVPYTNLRKCNIDNSHIINQPIETIYTPLQQATTTAVRNVALFVTFHIFYTDCEFLLETQTRKISHLRDARFW